MIINVSFLLEVVNRDNGKSIIEPVEKVYEFDEYNYRWESDRSLEMMALARYHNELRYQPSKWKGLVNESFKIECVILDKKYEDGRPYTRP